MSDSTSVEPGRAGSLGVTVVPLQVVIGAKAYDEGAAGPGTVASALAERTPVSTSRPAPETFLRAYRSLADTGCTAVVSVHLSGAVSGTVESARLAARAAPIPVHVVDSRQLGMATGFAVEQAAATRDDGASAEDVAESARRRAGATASLFYVDTLEYLRRGGRVGIAATLVGSALAVKPLLRIDDGSIVPFEKVRTSSRALARLEELAAEVAGGGAVDVAVAHLANPRRADELAIALRARMPGIDRLVVGEVGAVIGAHVGPGMLAVVVSPKPREAAGR